MAAAGGRADVGRAAGGGADGAAVGGGPGGTEGGVAAAGGGRADGAAGGGATTEAATAGGAAARTGSGIVGGSAAAAGGAATAGGTGCAGSAGSSPVVRPRRSSASLVSGWMVGSTQWAQPGWAPMRWAQPGWAQTRWAPPTPAAGPLPGRSTRSARRWPPRPCGCGRGCRRAARGVGSACLTPLGRGPPNTLALARRTPARRGSVGRRRSTGGVGVAGRGCLRIVPAEFRHVEPPFVVAVAIGRRRPLNPAGMTLARGPRRKVSTGQCRTFTNRTHHPRRVTIRRVRGEQ